MPREEDRHHNWFRLTARSAPDGRLRLPGLRLPGSVNAGVQAPVQTQQSGQAIHTFVTRSANQGTYLFPPAQGGNG